jgi:hypothetical protein
MADLPNASSKDAERQEQTKSGKLPANAVLEQQTGARHKKEQNTQACQINAELQLIQKRNEREAELRRI